MFTGLIEAVGTVVRLDAVAGGYRLAIATRLGPALREGDTLTLPIFGTGEVRQVGPESLTVAFLDGEVREFRR